MAKETAREGLVLQVAGNDPPCESTPDDAFLQARIRLFARVVLLICAGFYVLVNLFAALGPSHDWTCCATLPGNWFHLGTCALLAGMWGLSTRACLSRGALRTLDAWGSGLVCSAYAGVFLAEGVLDSNPHGLLFATANTLIARAIIVPSSPLRTLAVTSLAALPAAVTGSVLHPGGLESIAPLTLYNAWYLVAVIVATVASHVIYGLQRQVRKARRLGQYVLEEKLGEGGVGEVYRARHALLRRPTAVKLLRFEKTGAQNLARFEREVQLTSLLTHQNTVEVYDFGRTPEGVFYYAMEYLPGLTLQELVERFGPQPPARAIHILRQVCASLEEAHSLDFVHRDIKPANIILCQRGGVPDVVKVVDFGLVKDLGQDVPSDLSGANMVAGTPLYFSPEAVSSPREVGPRSDLYSLGAVGYYLLAGQPPFQGENVFEIAMHHIHTPPDPPSVRLGSPLPPDLEALLLECLEKDPARRPPDARTLKKALGDSSQAGQWSEEDARAWWEAHERAAESGKGRRKTAPQSRAKPDRTRTLRL